MIAHAPGAVITVGEPHIGELADRVRNAVLSRFGHSAAVALCDAGDMRVAGVLRPATPYFQEHLARRWVRQLLQHAIDRHDGEFPCSIPMVPVVLVVDAENAASRAVALGLARAVRTALGHLSLPAALRPRVVMLVAWPAAWRQQQAASLRAWSLDLEWLLRSGTGPDAAFLVAHSNYRSSERGQLHFLTRAERNDVVAAHVVALLGTSILHETEVLVRGLDRLPLMALGVGREEATAAGVVRKLDAGTWPYVHIDGGATGRPPATAAWLLGAAPEGHETLDRSEPLQGSLPGVTLIRCAHGFLFDDIAGVDAWDRAYEVVPPDDRGSLHRFAGAVRLRSPEPPPARAQNTSEVTP